MRVAVVYFPYSRNNELKKLSQALANGLEQQGHTVDLIDGHRDVNIHLTMYAYVAVGTGSISIFGGKISSFITQFLANAGTVMGKRCFAFVHKRGMRNSRTLLKLMQTMEHEGMLVKFSQILSNTTTARQTGEQLHI